MNDTPCLIDYRRQFIAPLPVQKRGSATKRPQWNAATQDVWAREVRLRLVQGGVFRIWTVEELRHLMLSEVAGYRPGLVEFVRLLESMADRGELMLACGLVRLPREMPRRCGGDDD